MVDKQEDHASSRSGYWPKESLNGPPSRGRGFGPLRKALFSGTPIVQNQPFAKEMLASESSALPDPNTNRRNQQPSVSFKVR